MFFPFTCPKARRSVNLTTVSVADPGAAGPRNSPFLSVTVPEENHAERMVISSRSFAAKPCTSSAETLLRVAKIVRNEIQTMTLNHFARDSGDCLNEYDFKACIPFNSSENIAMHGRVLFQNQRSNSPAPELKAGRGEKLFCTAWSRARRFRRCRRGGCSRGMGRCLHRNRGRSRRCSWHRLAYGGGEPCFIVLAADLLYF